MIRVLICEDEPLEREALRSLLETYIDSEVHIVGEAENGRIAIDLAERYRPDIIIMDIQMPVIDGLNASHKIRKLLPDTEIVISTAHGQFEYARQAIVVGVYDYLVKPATPAEFNQVMCSLIEKISDKRKKKQEEDRTGRLGVVARDLVERELILKLLRGQEASKSEITHLFHLLDLCNSFCAAALLRLEKNGPQQRVDEQSLVLSMRHFFRVVIICSLVDEVAIFLAKPKGNGGKEEYEHIIKNNTKIHNNIETYGFSELHKAPEGALELFREARASLDSSIEHNKAENNELRCLIVLENSLLDRIVCEEYEDSLRILQQLLNRVQESEVVKNINSYGNRLLVWLEASLDRFFTSRILAHDSEVYLERIERVQSTEDLYTFFYSFINIAVSEIGRHKCSANESLIKEIQNYIEAHIDEKISVHSLSESASISAGHLRKIFKQTTGEGIKEYIIGRKMNKAAIMLRKKKMIVKEVADQIGFTDQNYFSRVFKEHFGITPRDYMNR